MGYVLQRAVLSERAAASQTCELTGDQKAMLQFLV